MLEPAPRRANGTAKSRLGQLQFVYKLKQVKRGGAMFQNAAMPPIAQSLGK